MHQMKKQMMNKNTMNIYTLASFEASESDESFEDATNILIIYKTIATKLNYINALTSLF